MEPTNQGEGTKLSQVIQIDEGKMQEHLGEVVRSTVEETLNAMLDGEADRLCQPSGTNGLRRGRIREQVATSGSYRRKRVKSR
jgi:hypothetical protein